MSDNRSNINIELPTIRKDIVLMSPGTWNGFEYSAEEIKRAFELTDWKQASNLFLDHPEYPNNAAGLWAGRIINQRYSDGQIIGDLQLWDESTIIKTELAKAPFGVSPRVIGEEEGNRFSNFVFDNFSIVSKQAIAPAFINLSKTPLKSKVLYKETELSEEVKEFNRVSEKIQKEEELTDEEYKYMKKKMKSSSKENQKLKGGKKMSETNQETEVETKETETTETKSEDSPAQPEAEPEKKEEELSFDNLSVEELNAILDKVQKVIASKKPAVKEMSSDPALKEELAQMRKQVQELNAKLNKPAPKTQKSRGPIAAQLVAPQYSDGVREMAEMLKENFS